MRAAGNRAIEAIPKGRWALCAWVGFLLVVAGCVLFSRRAGVYPIFANAGRAWLDGNDLYQAFPGLDQFLYAPVTAALLVPWALLPERLGGLLWRGMGAGLFAFSLGRWAKTLQKSEPAFPLPGPTFWLLTLPLVGATIHNGQSNLFLLGLMLLGLSMLQERRFWAAASCLGMAGLLKVYPLFLGFLLCLNYPRLTSRLIVVLAIGLVLPFFLQAPEYVAWQYQGWFSALTQDRSLWALERAPRDLLLLTRLAGAPLDQGMYRLVQATLALGIVYLCIRLWAANASDERILHASFTLACCAMVVLGPAAESSTFCLLAPALCLALMNPALPSGQRAFLGTIWALLTASALACWFPAGKHVAGVLQPLAGLALFLERLAWVFESTLPGGQPLDRAPGKGILVGRILIPELIPEDRPCAAAPRGT